METVHDKNSSHLAFKALGKFAVDDFLKLMLFFDSDNWFKSPSSFPTDHYKAPAVPLCLCVCGFICGVCDVLICYTFFLPLERAELHVALRYFLDIFTYILALLGRRFTCNVKSYFV